MAGLSAIIVVFGRKNPSTPQTSAEDTLLMTFCLVRGYAIKLLISDSMDSYHRMMKRWKALVPAFKA